MSFSTAEAFFLLVLLIPFLFLVVYNYKSKQKILNLFVSDTAYRQLGSRSGKEIDFFKAALVILALLFFITALAGPEWGEIYEKVDIKGIEMVFLLDTSNSMNAEDLKPNRLEVAKQLMTGIVDNFNSDYVGLINFAGLPYVQCPATIDYEAFKLMAGASVISPDEEQGTDFGAAFRLALEAFKSPPESKKVLILITDGEDQEHAWLGDIPEFEKRNIIVFSVGVGAALGAPIPIKNEEGEIIDWKKDKGGNIVKTRLDEDSLIKIAAQTGGQYFRLTDPAAIDLFIKNLQGFERTELAEKVRLKKAKRFYYPLVLGIIFLIFEMFLTEKRLTWTKR